MKPEKTGKVFLLTAPCILYRSDISLQAIWRHTDRKIDGRFSKRKKVLMIQMEYSDIKNRKILTTLVASFVKILSKNWNYFW